MSSLLSIANIFLRFRIKRRWTVHRETDAGPRDIRNPRRIEPEGETGSVAVRRRRNRFLHSIEEQLQEKGQTSQHQGEVTRYAGFE